MNKKLWLLVVSLITAIVLSACNQSINDVEMMLDSDCASGYAIRLGDEDRCVTADEAEIARREAKNFMGNGGSSVGSSEEPAGEIASGDAGAGGNGSGGSSSCADMDFSKYVGQPYELIAILDTQAGKTPQASTNYTIQTDHDILYWTGAYIGRWPQGFVPLIVDGKTGVFCVSAGTTATVNFVGAYMKASEFNPNAQVVASTGMPSGCMNKEDLAVGLNQYHNDTETLVRWLDSQVNVEGAPHLDARIRPNPLAAATYENQKPVTMVFWLSDGSVQGKEGTDFVYLSRGSGIGVYLIATDRAVIDKAHTGLMVCGDGLHPDIDLDYWK